MNACRRALRGLLVALVALTVPAVAAPARAASDQAAGDQATAATAAQVEALVATLEDAGQRRALIERLKLLLAAQEAEKPPATAESIGAQVLVAISKRMAEVGAELAALAALAVDIPAAAQRATTALSDAETRRAWSMAALKLALVLAAGVVAGWLMARLLKRPREAVEDRETDSLLLRLPLLVLRTILDLLPVAAFAAAAYGALPLTEPAPGTRLFALIVVNAHVLARAVVSVARMVLAPRVASLRVMALGDESANYLFIWVRRFTLAAVYGFFGAQAALLFGLPAGAYALVVKAVGLVLAAMIVVLVSQNRAFVAKAIAGDGEAAPFGGLRRRLADIWHVLAVVYVVAAYGVWLLDVAGGFAFLARATLLTLVVVVAAWLTIVALRHGVERLFRLRGEVRERFPRLESRANRYLPGLHASLRAVVYALAGVTLLQVWGIGVFDWLASDTGRALIARVATIALILVATLVVWEVGSSLVERGLERAKGDQDDGAVRLRTLLPLLRNALRVVLGILVTLTVLSEVGIDIAPLLAGAGVVGLAVGFGAQTLVKDVITGVFILLEDSLAVGDWVDLGGRSGSVERMTIRSIRLRDVDGSIYTIPFSDVTTVRNFARDYGYAILNIGVAYREDLDEVERVIRAVGDEMRADPAIGPRILAPIEIQGVNALDDSAVVIRARIRTRPMAHWGLRRDFNRRIKLAFDAHGIEIPYPHQTVYFGVDKDGQAPPARVVIEDETEAETENKPAPRPA